MIQTSHGLYLDDAALVKKVSPSIKTLALLKESSFYGWKKANLGAGRGVQVAEEVGTNIVSIPLSLVLHLLAWVSRRFQLQCALELGKNKSLIYSSPSKGLRSNSSPRLALMRGS